MWQAIMDKSAWQTAFFLVPWKRLEFWRSLPGHRLIQDTCPLLLHVHLASQLHANHASTTNLKLKSNPITELIDHKQGWVGCSIDIIICYKSGNISYIFMTFTNKFSTTFTPIMSINIQIEVRMELFGIKNRNLTFVFDMVQLISTYLVISGIIVFQSTWESANRSLFCHSLWVIWQQVCIGYRDALDSQKPNSLVSV